MGGRTIGQTCDNDVAGLPAEAVEYDGRSGTCIRNEDAFLRLSTNKLRKATSHREKQWMILKTNESVWIGLDMVRQYGTRPMYRGGQRSEGTYEATRQKMKTQVERD